MVRSHPLEPEIPARKDAQCDSGLRASDASSAAGDGSSPPMVRLRDGRATAKSRRRRFDSCTAPPMDGVAQSGRAGVAPYVAGSNPAPIRLPHRRADTMDNGMLPSPFPRHFPIVSSPLWAKVDAYCPRRASLKLPGFLRPPLHGGWTVYGFDYPSVSRETCALVVHLPPERAGQGCVLVN